MGSWHSDTYPGLWPPLIFIQAVFRWYCWAQETRHSHLAAHQVSICSEGSQLAIVSFNDFWHGKAWVSMPRRFNRGEKDQNGEMWSPTNGETPQEHRKQHRFWPPSADSQPLLDINHLQTQCWPCFEQDVSLGDFLRSLSTRSLSPMVTKSLHGIAEIPKEEENHHQESASQQFADCWLESGTWLRTPKSGHYWMNLYGDASSSPMGRSWLLHPCCLSTTQHQPWRRHEGSSCPFLLTQGTKSWSWLRSKEENGRWETETSTRG